MSDEELKNIITKGIKKAQEGNLYFELIFNNQDEPVKKNEFLFFIKPEITLQSNKIKLNDILDLFLYNLKNYNFSIHNIKVLSAEYLKEYNIIAQHYGVINKLASNALQNLSESAKSSFIKHYNTDFDKVKIKGGMEFLKEYSEFTPFTLDILWKNKQNIKLGSGTYCEDISLDNEIIYLINGFHPRQIEHFTKPGRSIIVFTISSDIDWNIARNYFIGSTDPWKAVAGSIRRELLDKKEMFGLDEVFQGFNGVHLSAGPVEALIELVRYNSNFKNPSEIMKIEDFSFGRLIKKEFKEDLISKILNNINVNFNGLASSIFDLTEEKNAEVALQILKNIL